MSNFKNYYIVFLLFFLNLTNTFSKNQNPTQDSQQENISVSLNGKFIYPPHNKSSKTNSQNGNYWCNYEIGNVGDEYRELLNFKFYENEQLLFSLQNAPGSDLYISDAGFIAFFDHQFHFRQELIIHFYSKDGRHLKTQNFEGASLFGFSQGGNYFGVGNSSNLFVLSLKDQHLEIYDRCDQFDISETGNFVVTARSEIISIYFNGILKQEINTQYNYPRKIKVNEKHNILAVIDKKKLLAILFQQPD